MGESYHDSSGESKEGELDEGEKRRMMRMKMKGERRDG